MSAGVALGRCGHFDAIGCGKLAGQLDSRHPTAHDHQVGDHELRSAFGHHPFTIGEARCFGVTFKKLSGPAYRRLFRGVYAVAETAELGVADGEVVRAVRRMIGGSAVIDGLSALQLRGLDLGVLVPISLAVPHTRRLRRAGISVRRCRTLPPHDVSGVAYTRSAFQRCCRDLSLTDAVIVGDRLGHRELARPGELATDQPAAQLVRSGVESPRESLLRLALVLAGLPEPECNAWVVDGGRRIARVDLYYPHHRVSLDYEGDHHRTDRRQWNRDIERYADLAAAGVEAIRVTALALQRANNVVLRTYRILQDRGYAGPPPHFGPLWMPTFSRPRGVAWNQVPITAL